MTNPLLRQDGLPAFDEIRPEHVAPAIDALLQANDEALERAVGPDVPSDYDAVSAVLDTASERLHRAWGAVGHLNAVADTPELRAACEARKAAQRTAAYDEAQRREQARVDDVRRCAVLCCVGSRV